MEFDWDEHNLFHIAMHGVTREQVESAMQARPVHIKSEVRNGERRESYVGQSSVGVILIVVTTVRGQKTRCVTAFRANSIFRNVFLLKRGFIV